MLDSATSTWLWLGFAGMSVGTLAILTYWSKFKPEHRYHVILALMVTTIAGAAYYAMVSGQGVIMFNGKTIFFARYLDWVLTTPLLLLSLITIALPEAKDTNNSRQRMGLIGAILFADVSMIITGAIANFSANQQDVVVWYVASCLWFGVIVYLMFVEVRALAQSQSKDLNKVYISLLLLLSSLWFFYPIVWLLGNSGFAVVDLTTEVAVYAVLDVTAKAVFGTLALSKLLKVKGSNSR